MWLKLIKLILDINGKYVLEKTDIVDSLALFCSAGTLYSTNPSVVSEGMMGD